MVLVTVGAAMILVNLPFDHAALLVATDPAYTGGIGAAGSDALVLLLVDLHDAGYTIAGIFFGLWLLPLGYLVVRSRMFPRLLGGLLIAAGVSWIVDTLVRFAAPDLPGIVHVALSAPQFAEVAMMLYLLIKGVKPAPPDHQPAAPRHETELITREARA